MLRSWCVCVLYDVSLLRWIGYAFKKRDDLTLCFLNVEKTKKWRKRGVREEGERENGILEGQKYIKNRCYSLNERKSSLGVLMKLDEPKTLLHWGLLYIIFAQQI